ncbi:MAG: HAD-IA family hydrolase [Bacteroidia bacterium]
MKRVQTIILDLGGVILDLHQESTVRGFEEYGIDYYSLSINDQTLDHFEKGWIKENQFREFVKSISDKEISDLEIDKIWNAMLGDLPFARIELIKELSKDFEIYLLSNTNSIHIRWFDQYFRKNFVNENWNHLFKKIFYSFEIGMRKPDKEIFEFCLGQINRDGAECIFIDDNKTNLEGAERCGIQTVWAKEPLSDQLMRKIISRAK